MNKPDQTINDYIQMIDNLERKLEKDIDSLISKLSLTVSGLIKANAEILDLRQQISRKDKALAFYANESNYDMDYDPSEGHSSEMLKDCGEKAREALI